MGPSRRADDDKIRRKRTPSFPSYESIVSRNAQKQRRWKITFHFCADGDTIETVFRTSVCIYGAVSELCEEYSACQTRTVRPVLAGQSDPLFASANLLIMTPRPSIEIPAQENWLQKYKERVERLAQQNRVIFLICTDTGFLTTVEVGQYFMTKAHRQVLTIYRTSDMSWVFVTTRRQINWPERLDSREHQNWARVWSHNQLLVR